MDKTALNNKKLFIFDLDGTLADAYTAIEKSLNFTLKKIGLAPVGYEKVKRTVGMGDRIFMESFFPEKDIEKALKIYRAHHRKALLRYVKLRPFARRLLYALKRRNKFLAIASNRPNYFTNIILKKLGIRKYFDIVLCADEINSLKPNSKILNTIVKKLSLQKQEALYVGDMVIDAETAERAGINFVFVTGGSSKLQEARKYKIHSVTSSLKEIAVSPSIVM